MLEGAEVCDAGSDRSPFKMFHVKGGRVYKLDLHSNKVGRFLLCSVRPVEEKKFSLVFLEGRRLLGGWKVLANKLRSLGAVPLPKIKEAVSTVNGQMETWIKTSENIGYQWPSIG